jgi:thiol-disulfide isomerase/thioredoxin
MNKFKKVILIVVSSLLVIGASLWGGYEYITFRAKYPFTEYEKVKGLISVDPLKASQKFIKLIAWINENNSAERFKSRHFEYIITFVAIEASAKEKNNAESKFLNHLWENGDAEIKQMIAPYIHYHKVLNSNSADAVNEGILRFIVLLDEKGNCKNKAERFALMLHDKLESKNADSELRKRLLDRVKRNLVKTNFTEENWEIWRKFMLSYSYYLEYKNCKNDDERLSALEKLTHTLPEKKYTNFQFEEMAIGHSMVELGMKHVDYHLSLGNKKKAYAVLTDLNLKNPDLFFDHYVSFFEIVNGEKLTNNEWKEALMKFMPRTPDVSYVLMDGSRYSLLAKRKNWVLMDFWGSWCPPCVQQLPEIQSFYIKNKNVIDVITVASRSKNLKNFMEKNQYTFPVASVEEVEGFDINSFPTKLLISPDGNYVLVPNAENWVDFVRRITREYDIVD